ncbi:MAG: restriction endonuclease [Sterolibacteriaceae bacterium]|uniref:Restriction endonuclease n=1 Tax=Candidatus Methylophosphatis roskildensis TaxID=2899263 RepID=A0A9D7E4Z0_9PROT|nr:restriction endonuclease [Candidatus Methylophosphatis roskildensis]
MIDTGMGTVDITVDEVYGGSRNGNSSDDPLPSLLDVDNGAGFRHLGQRPEVRTLKLLVLKTSFSDTKWPDAMDRESGIFVYYGDKRAPGDLHQTPRQGNLMLRNLFDEAHQHQQSATFPPILLFGNTGTYRDVRFLGLAVPGAAGMGSDDDLVAVWRTTNDGVRFQNYKATFTVLDVPVVTRAWVKDIQAGKAVSSAYAPKQWLDWVGGRKYSPLKSSPVSSIRSKQQQLPDTPDLASYVGLVYEFYKDDPHAFERCAMQLARLFMPSIQHWEITRPWRDGGRDAVGTYRIGHGAGAIDVEFAMEAKCYGINKGVGIKPLSRLISRLRHRQFGILVTTSYLDSQAYNELVQDAHPVVVISAGDIAAKLKERFGSLDNIRVWLQKI